MDPVCIHHHVSLDQYTLILLLFTSVDEGGEKVHHSVLVNLRYELSRWARITSKYKGKVSTCFMDLLGICIGGWSGPCIIRTIYQAKEGMKYSCSTAVFIVVYMEVSSINRSMGLPTPCTHVRLCSAEINNLWLPCTSETQSKIGITWMRLILSQLQQRVFVNGAAFTSAVWSSHCLGLYLTEALRWITVQITCEQF